MIWRNETEILKCFIITIRFFLSNLFRSSQPWNDFWQSIQKLLNFNFFFLFFFCYLNQKKSTECWTWQNVHAFEIFIDNTYELNFLFSFILRQSFGLWIISRRRWIFGETNLQSLEWIWTMKVEQNKLKIAMNNYELFVQGGRIKHRH
jgi:hypothetical protein